MPLRYPASLWSLVGLDFGVCGALHNAVPHALPPPRGSGKATLGTEAPSLVTEAHVQRFLTLGTAGCSVVGCQEPCECSARQRRGC